MPLVQAIIQALVQGLTFFVPIGSDVHAELAHFWLGWDPPEHGFWAATTMGGAVALFIYFRHDWASIISSFLRVILLRKKPMTFDERMPFFQALASAPAIAFQFVSSNPLLQIDRTPIVMGGLMIGLTFPLWFLDSMNRRNKKLLDWNWLDSLWVGLHQILHLIPGSGLTYGAWLAASFRNYNREAAAKFILFITFPLLLSKVLIHTPFISFTSSSPSADLNWMTFIFTFAISMVGSLISIASFMNWVERNTLTGYAIYRVLLGTAILAVSWWVKH
jgi:undecaprenyl-diphosphatase